MLYSDKERALECSQVANYLLDRFDPIKYNLTNLKINKVVYFLHGYCLAKFERPLIRNHFEAWEYGPVVGNLYHTLKNFGDRPVTKKISYLNYETGEVEEVSFSDVFSRFGNRLDEVSHNLTKLDVWALVFQTHAEGGAWDEIQKAQSSPKRSTRIPDSLIAEHYRNLVGGKIVN